MNRKLKIILCLLFVIAAVCALALAGCGEETTGGTSSTAASSSAAASSGTGETSSPTVPATTSSTDSSSASESSEEDHTHTYEYDSVKWNDSYSMATITVKCSCGDTQSIIITNIVKDEYDATCTEASKTVYSASYSYNGVEGTQSVTLYDGEPLGHDYTTTIEFYNDEVSGEVKATATRVCSHDSSHTDTIDCVVTYSTTDASCVVTGDVVYTATATFEDGLGNSTAEKTVTGSALGHSYTAEFTWAEDYSSATAVLTCQREGCTDETEGHQLTVSAEDITITTEKVAATCISKGSITYIATYGSYTDSATVETPVSTTHSSVTGHATKATSATTYTKAYWYCSTCGKYFSDEACTKEITEDEAKTEYNFSGTIYDPYYLEIEETGKLAEGTSLFDGFITTVGSVSWYNNKEESSSDNNIAEGYVFKGNFTIGTLFTTSGSLTFTLDSAATLTLYAKMSYNYATVITDANGNVSASIKAETTTLAATIVAYEIDLNAGTYTISNSNTNVSIFAIVLTGSGYDSGIWNFWLEDEEELADNQFKLQAEEEYTFYALQTGYYTFTIPKVDANIWSGLADYEDEENATPDYLAANAEGGNYSFEVYIEAGDTIVLYLTNVSSVIVTYTVSATSSDTPEVTITTSVPEELALGVNNISLSSGDASDGVTSTFTATADGTYTFYAYGDNAFMTINGTSTSGYRLHDDITETLELTAGDVVTIYFYSYSGTAAEYILFISDGTITYEGEDEDYEPAFKVPGETEISITADGYFYERVSAPSTGSYTFTVTSNDDISALSVVVYYGDNDNVDILEQSGNTYTVDYSTGNSIYIYVYFSNDKGEASDVTITLTISVEADETDTDATDGDSTDTDSTDSATAK